MFKVKVLFFIFACFGLTTLAEAHDFYHHERHHGGYHGYDRVVPPPVIFSIGPEGMTIGVGVPQVYIAPPPQVYYRTEERCEPRYSRDYYGRLHREPPYCYLVQVPIRNW